MISSIPMKIYGIMSLLFCLYSCRIANATQKKDSGDESDENLNKDEDWGAEKKGKTRKVLQKKKDIAICIISFFPSSHL